MLRIISEKNSNNCIAYIKKTHHKCVNARNWHQCWTLSTGKTCGESSSAPDREITTNDVGGIDGRKGALGEVVLSMSTLVYASDNASNDRVTTNQLTVG